jgi:hypothetical protein
MRELVPQLWNEATAETGLGARSGNPLFSASGRDSWDHEIRERGFITHPALKLWLPRGTSPARAR